jgi:hypothetical protein
VVFLLAVCAIRILTWFSLQMSEHMNGFHNFFRQVCPNPRASHSDADSSRRSVRDDLGPSAIQSH